MFKIEIKKKKKKSNFHSQSLNIKKVKSEEVKKIV